MEQELRFGLDSGRLALLKKNIWADYEQLLRPVFSSLLGQKKRKTSMKGISSIKPEMGILIIYSYSVIDART